jgi:glycosyltransferase involved in cell wall biosynthesis
MYAAVARQTGGSAPVISAVRASALSFTESRLDAVLHAAAAHLGDHLTVNSEDVMTWMSHREVPPDRMSYVPNILPDAVVQRPTASEEDRATALQAYGLSVNEPPIVLIGRFDEYKNQDGLVRAVAKLVGRGVKVPPLLLIGRFTDAARVAAIRELAAANGMPKVVLAPPTSNALGIMQAARLVALTSHSEGTPNVVLEALGLGCHVVSTPVGQVPDVVVQGVTGCLAPDTTDEGIAAVLQHALAMPPEAVVKMGEAARCDVRLRFSAASAAALLDALYRRVMQQQRPARWRAMRLAVKHAGAALCGFSKENWAYKAGDR